MDQVLAQWQPIIQGDPELAFLPQEKQGKVKAILSDYAQKLKPLSDPGARSGSEAKRISEIQRERELAISRALTPEEFENYQLYYSDTAARMRKHVRDFSYSGEEEFKEIFRLQFKYDEVFFFPGESAEPPDPLRYRAALAEKDAGIQKILGESRYREYVRGQDYDYWLMLRICEQEGLGRDSAASLYELKREHLAAVKAIEAIPGIDPGEKAVRIRSALSETSQKTLSILGTKGFQEYRLDPRAAWLRGN